jgi:probable phosphoglycerate mutase
MVKTIHLVRHGHHALLGRVLCGRMRGIELDEIGCRQMSLCADLIAPAPCVIQSSPQRRAQQSAGILAWRFGLPVEIVSAADEIDFGAWTGASFGELDDDPCWRRWNSRRGTGRPPNGEDMRSVQRRIVQHLEQLGNDHADGTIAIVSHAEPIRAALLHYSKIELDNFQSIEVDPASVSTLSVDKAGIHVCQINQRIPA